MADTPNPAPVTAQTRFQQAMQQAFALPADTALQLWTKLAAFLRDKPQLRDLPLAVGTTADLNDGYSQRIAQCSNSPKNTACCRTWLRNSSIAS